MRDKQLTLKYNVIGTNPVDIYTEYSTSFAQDFELSIQHYLRCYSVRS